MFKFRSGGQGAPSPAQPPTIEAMRRRARHRLIGASVLVLAGVVGFPLLFDSKPRPIPVDIPIDIPAKNSVKPLTLVPAVKPSAGVEGLDASEEVVSSSGKTSVAPVAVGAAAVVAVASSAVVTAADAPPAAAAGNKTAPAALAAPVAVTPASDKSASGTSKVAEAKPAKALDSAASSRGSDSPSAAKVPAKSDKVSDKASEKSKDKGDKADKSDKGDARVVVQVGAFADADRAHEVRQKLEHAGLKTYTHVADTPEGKRIRVRLGPFSTRGEADKAAAKVKALGLPAAVLTL